MITVCVLTQEGLLCLCGFQQFILHCQLEKEKQKLDLAGNIVEVILSEKW